MRGKGGGEGGARRLFRGLLRCGGGREVKVGGERPSLYFSSASSPPPPKALAAASLDFLYTQIPLLPVIKKNQALSSVLCPLSSVLSSGGRGDRRKVSEEMHNFKIKLR